MIGLLLLVGAFGVGVFIAIYAAWTAGAVHGYDRGYRDRDRGR